VEFSDPIAAIGGMYPTGEFAIEEDAPAPSGDERAIFAPANSVRAHCAAL
jgi:hypothetical protein